MAQGEVETSARKRRKLNNGSVQPVLDENEVDIADDVLDLIDDAPDIKTLDINDLRELIGRFQKCILKNEEMRTKYIDDPTKFMQSEINLDGIIHELTQQLPTLPHLYKDFVLMKGVSYLIKLLFHDNLDITVSVIGFLREMTEPDSYQESKTAITFINEFVTNNGIKILLENLQRLNDPNVVEPKKKKSKKSRFKSKNENEENDNSMLNENDNKEDDYDSIYAILAIIENICDLDIDGTFRVEMVKQSKIFKMLLNMIRKRQEYGKEFSEITLYCSELICILLQTMDNEIIFSRFAEIKGNDKIISLLKSKYCDKDPRLSEEKEFVSNLLDALTFSLVSIVNQNQFSNSPVAMQNLLELVRSKSYVRQGALKALSYAIMNHKGNCDLLLKENGLGTLFSNFMKKKIGKKYKHSHNLDEIEESIVLIIMHLFIHLNDVNLLRLINKFKEKNFEKIDRLIDLHCKYWNRIEENDIETLKKLANNNKNNNHNGNNKNNNRMEELPSERYERRMDVGLATLQSIDMIIAFIYTLKNTEMNERIDQILSQNDNDLQIIKDIIKEFAIVSKDEDEVEDQDDASQSENEKKTDNEKMSQPNIGAIAAKLFEIMDQMTQVAD